MIALTKDRKQLIQDLAKTKGELERVDGTDLNRARELREEISRLERELALYDMQ